MSEERRMSISSSSRLSPDEVARHTFATVRRGFDPAEVREFLDSVAGELRAWVERESALRTEVADAEHRAANPVLDEATLTSALGTETARVLRSAHEAAHDMVAKAEAEAERLLDRARSEIDEAETRAETALAERTAQAEAAVAELRRRVQEESAVVLESARAEAEAMVAQARAECREMVDEAQALRSRVLADLSRRRKVLHAQIEQLRAGRERLVETIRGVRRSVDVIAEDLFRAEDEARLAAESAGRDALARPEDGTPEEQAASLLAEEAAAPAGAEPHGADRGADGAAAATDEVAADEVAADLPGPEAPATDTADVDAVSAGEGPAAEPDPGERAVAEPVVGASDGGGDEGGDGDHEPGGADRLAAAEEAFAKLRAASGPPAGAGATSGEVDTGTEETVDQSGGDGTGAPPAPGHPTAGEQPTDGTAVDGSEDGTGPAARRDELVAPVVAALARRVKRVLQDDQNEILDRIRSHGGTWSDDALADEVEQRDALVTAALPHLEQAALAGRAFLDPSASGNPETDTLLAIAGELADSLLLPLRRRLADDGGLAGADEQAVTEHVGAAFREWKGERVERLVADQVIAAFSAGTLASSRGPVTWHAVSADGSPCPDCEDNALAGPLSAGEAFPTGHLTPPAHPGCRCLLTSDVP